MSDRLESGQFLVEWMVLRLTVVVTGGYADFQLAAKVNTSIRGPQERLDVENR